MSVPSFDNLLKYNSLMQEYDSTSQEIIPSKWNRHQALLAGLLVVLCTYRPCIYCAY